MLAARADVHRLRKILGPGERISAAPSSGNGFTCADPRRRYASFLD